MKFILSSLILLGFFSNWNANDNVKLVTEAIVESYAEDSIKVFHKYDNMSLYERLEEYKLFYDFENSKKNDTLEFDVSLALYDDDLEINFHKVNFKYYEELKYLKRSKRKKLLSNFKSHLSRKDLDVIVHISKPIISIDGNKALSYITYTCGPLCGTGGIQLLEKKDGNWILMDMMEAWIS